jgi:RNA polymerase sigma factor (sigma-70 family)
VRDFFAGYIKCPQDVEDLVQDVFARLIQQGHIPQGPRVYIRVAAKNRLRSYWRSKKMHLFAERKMSVHWDGTTPISAVAELNCSPFDQLSAAELKHRIAHAIGELPKRSIEILRLRIKQGLSFDEIAQTIHCSRDTAKKRLQRAKRRLWESCRRTEE